jgi:hypothetical protein
MRRCWSVLFFVFAAPAYAVDGAGLQLIDIFGVLVLLFGAALPFLLVAGLIVFFVLAVRAVAYGRPGDDTLRFEVLPPAIGEIEFTNEEADLMQRAKIFFTGTHFRVGDRKFDTLADALADADETKLGVHES